MIYATNTLDFHEKIQLITADVFKPYTGPKSVTAVERVQLTRAEVLKKHKQVIDKLRKFWEVPDIQALIKDLDQLTADEVRVLPLELKTYLHCLNASLLKGANMTDNEDSITVTTKYSTEMEYAGTGV